MTRVCRDRRTRREGRLTDELICLRGQDPLIDASVRAAQA